MRFLMILAMVFVVCQMGCVRAADPELATADGPVLLHCSSSNRAGGL